MMRVRIPWRRPAATPGHWMGLACVVLVVVAAAAVGFRLIEHAARAPAAVEAALQVEALSTVVVSAVADLESDRRGYALTGMHEHFAAIRSDHARAHAALGLLRDAVAGVPSLVRHLDSAEAAIGVWSEDAPSVSTAAGALRRGVSRDETLLGAAREHVQRVVAAADSAAGVARARVHAARSQARLLWLVVTGGALLAIVALAEVARRRQVQAREAARESGLLLEALPFAVVSVGGDGLIRHAAGRVKAVLGTAPERLVGRSFAELYVSLDRGRVASGLSQALADRHWACEAQVQAEFDGARVLSLAFAPLVEDGRAVGASVVARDSTVERAFKTDLRQADRLASVGATAASVVHELSGRLAPILGLVASVKTDGLDDEDRAALRTIASEARRAARMVRTILEFAHAHAHRHVPTSLGDVLAQALELRRYDPRSRDIEFVLDVAPDLPPVMADSQELLQVFLNLLRNAENAVRDQRLRRVVVRAWAEGRRVFAAVEDSGPGIPADKLETVFQPFYTTKPRGEGTGLGLALARGVVKEHQGSIVAEPAPSGGARLVVTLRALTGVGTAAGGPLDPGPSAGGLEAPLSETA